MTTKIVMGGLEPPTQRVRVCGRKRFIRGADAPRLGGRVEPGHDKYGHGLGTY